MYAGTLCVHSVSAHCVSLCLRALSFRAGPCACTPSFFPFLHGPSTCVQLIYVCRDPLRALCQCALCLTVSHCVCVHCLSVQDPVRALRLFFLSYMFPPRMFKPLSVQGPSTCTLSGISTPELQAAQADAKIMNSGQVRVCVCICVWGGNKFLRGCLWEGGSNLAFLLYNVILLSYKHFVLPFA